MALRSLPKNQQFDDEKNEKIDHTNRKSKFGSFKQKPFQLLSNWFKKPNTRKINHWILGDTLGMGGYSKVKLGIHEKTGVKAALKIMFAEGGKMAVNKKNQLQRELNVMSKVKHPNVVQLIEYDDNCSYPENDGHHTPCILIVLEFVPGGELYDYLMFTGRFDERATRSFFHQLIDGLEAIHRAGIAHRDLKPENLLLDLEGNLKIADFGFAKQYITENGQNTMDTLCGSPGYLAPELLKGRKYNHKCDIFGVGIIMFTTFTGFPPFQNAVSSDWWWDKLNKGCKYLEHSKHIQHTPDEAMKYHQASGKYKKLFWKAHEKSLGEEIPAQFKYLMEFVLHPMPAVRWDIEDIRKDIWFNSKRYKQSELQEYLVSREAKVRKDRVNKIMLQMQKKQKDSKTENTPRIVISLSERLDLAQVRAKQLDPKNNFMKCREYLSDNLFGKVLFEYHTVQHPAVIAASIEFIVNESFGVCMIDPSSNVILFRSKYRFEADPKIPLEEQVETEVSVGVKMFLEKDIKVDPQYLTDKIDFKQNISLVVQFKRIQGMHHAYKMLMNKFWDHDCLVATMNI